MKPKNLILFLITLMILFATINSNSQVFYWPPNCEEQECPLDPTFPPEIKVLNRCIYDNTANTYCCIELTYEATRHLPCPPRSAFPYRKYRIISVKAVGPCHDSQEEIMKTAVKTILAQSSAFDGGQGVISVPSCIEHTTCDYVNQESFWKGCDGTVPVPCCRYYFKAGWDSTARDLRLIGSELDSNMVISCNYINPYYCVQCDSNCNESLFPEDGLLDMYSPIPDACSTCSTGSIGKKPLIVDYVDDVNGVKISGGGSYYEYDTDPAIHCLELQYIWIHSNGSNITPLEATELYIKKVLSDYIVSLNVALPCTIKFNVRKCIGKIYPENEVYAGCFEGCCELEFEIDQQAPPGIGMEVININRNPSTPSPECLGCLDVCANIFNSYPFLLEKANISELDEYEPIDVKVIPNPTNGTFSIAFNTISKGTYALSITDMIGQEIYTSNLDVGVGFNNFEINLTNIANGVYYIQLIDNGQLITTTKFIKN